MTSEEIKRAREICDAATPGLWEYLKGCIVEKTTLQRITGSAYLKNENALFIAEARTIMPKALDALESMQKELDEQCRLNAMGQERELKLMTELKYAEKVIAYARKTVNDHDYRCEDTNGSLAELEEAIKEYDQQVS